MHKALPLPILVLLVALSFACGSGGNDDDPGDTRDPGLGFPDVAGTWEGEYYNMAPFNCPEGFPEGEDTAPLRMEIAQDARNLYPNQIYRPDERIEELQATVISDTGWGGLVEADGTFVLGRETALMHDLFGYQNWQTTINGTFVSDERLGGEVRNRLTVGGDATCDYFGDARADKP